MSRKRRSHCIHCGGKSTVLSCGVRRGGDMSLEAVPGEVLVVELVLEEVADECWCGGGAVPGIQDTLPGVSASSFVPL